METITKYKAIDGTEYTNKDECLEYEKLIDRVNKLMALLPQVPESNFTNGQGFIQHKKENLMSVRRHLLEICKEYIDHNWIQQTIDDYNIDPSWVARLLGDYNIRPLSNAWHRFSCIDKQQREWGQPYFAINPEKGEQVCVG